MSFDTLLRERGIDAVIVPMHEAMHPAFRWLTRGVKVTRGYAVRLVGQEPVVVTYPMERGEAAATGLTVHQVHDFVATAPSNTETYADFFTSVLRSLGGDAVGAGADPPKPTIAFFGNAPLQLYLGMSEAMERRGWLLYRGDGEDLIRLARKRKEPWEIAAIRSVGERTELVVDGVRALLRESRPGLTLGDLKSFVAAEIARLGMVEDHETILSQGRDAGIPHSRGDASAPVRPSVPLVLDIFPADRASGYFFDFTRTFCTGPIPEELAQLHAHVLEAFTRARDAMRPGTFAYGYQALVCDYFEEQGFPTLRSHPRNTSGYVHGLGHGVGLEIHESPSFAASTGDTVEVGDILTIEPGLYFPDRDLGIRIEDTFVITASGAESLCRTGYGLAP